jgi:GAF domain-containing protein
MADFNNAFNDDRTTARLVLEELLLETPAVGNLLDRAAVAAVEGSDRFCGITVATRYGALTMASSDARASVVDEFQYATGDGQCLAAMRTGEPVTVDDLSMETRWGTYPRLAANVGVRSSLSYPLLVDGQPAGALNVYSPRAGPWPADDEAVVLILALQIAGVLHSVRGFATGMDLDPKSAQALADQPRLDIATGILMSRCHCSEPEARAMLHADADSHHQTMRQAAEDLIDDATS